MFDASKAFSSFSVDDIAAAKSFYGVTLGLDVSEEHGVLWVRAAQGTGILVYSKPNHTPASFTILNFPVADIDEAVDELTRRGCASSGTRASSRTRRASFAATRDPRSRGSQMWPATSCRCSRGTRTLAMSFPGVNGCKR
jgi:hypothetical protein